MKKLFHVLVMLLAINFLIMAGAAGWLYREGRLDRENLLAIREVLFPAPPPAVPEPAVPAPEQVPPLLKLEELLAVSAGRPAAEQLEYIRRSFDAQMAQLERAQRELIHLQRQVELAQRQLGRDRAALQAEQATLAARKEEAQRLNTDQGFQDSLALYQTLSPRQVKAIFMDLDDQAVMRYIQAMEPRSASKITKEFKTAQELERLRTILEKMRQAEVSTME
jgi:hypothetical protein